jgi:O-antigen/teichoic acid export membrane protein
MKDEKAGCLKPEIETINKMTQTGSALIRAAIVRLAARAVLVVIGIVLLPFIVKSLGDRLYGVWVVVATLVGYYGLLDLGLTSAVSRFVSQALGRDDKTEANRYIASSFFIYCLGGLIAFLITVIAALICGYFLDNPADIPLFQAVILIVGLSFAVKFPSRCFYGILAAHLRFDLVGYIEMFSSLLRAGLIFLALVLGYKIIALAAIGALSNVGQAIAFWFFARRAHGKIPLAPKLSRRSHIRQLFDYAKYSFVCQLTDILRQNYAPLIVSGFLGLAAVTPFAVAEKLRWMIGTCSESLLSTLTPVFSRQEGRNDHEAMQRSYFFTYKISCYAGIYLTGMLGVCGAAFIERWMGPGRGQIVTLVYIGLPGLMAAMIQMPTVNLLYGTSRNRSYAILNLAHASSSILLAFLLVKPLGVAGVMLAVSAATVVMKLLFQSLLAANIFEISLMRYHLSHTLPNIIRPALYVGAALFASQGLLTASYPSLFMFGAAVSLGFIPFIFWLGFNGYERGLFIEAVKRKTDGRKDEG